MRRVFAFGSGALSCMLLLSACGGSDSSDSTTTTSTQQYSLSGNITGLSSSGLVLANAGVTQTIIAADSSFSFGLIDTGTAYAISIEAQPTAATCTLSNASGVLQADVSNVEVTCEGNIPPAADLTHLKLGTPDIVLAANGATPAVGKLWLCELPPNGAGAVISSDWMNADGTWDYTRKPHVDGAVHWDSKMIVTVNGSQRMIQGNALPTLPTGVFPIDPSSVAYQYDGNPSSINEHAVDMTLPAVPTELETPNCMRYGASGIALDGAAIYHGASTLGTDAAASEMLDDCGGQADGSNTYHYHYMTPCQIEKFDNNSAGHSALMGYMMDGFGIYGPRGEDGNVLTNADLDICHGHAHSVEWDGVPQVIYHYHWTYEFPYNIGCFRGTPTRPWNAEMNHNH